MRVMSASRVLDPLDAASDLPRDARSVLEMAARSMFQLFAETAEGMMVVDRSGRVVWISEGYKQFLPALGLKDEAEFVGHPVEEVVPNTLMHEVIATGRPILVDLLTNKAGTFLVSRIPLRDEAGEVIGALGLVLMAHPESTMQPLMKKFAMLQRELDDARKQLAEQRRPKYTFASFIGTSPEAMEVKRQARRVASTDSTVLLLGETGTGKELLAHAIHAASSRAARPFIGVNIAAVPETLLEAEFFGVAPGAYTGADRKGRDGKFKLADGGTLFLDEIGDMHLSTQAKILRVLQDQTFTRLGGNRPIEVDVRVIAATNKDLWSEIEMGNFRADLYYRLNVVTLHIPPLRKRREDIPLIAEFFRRKFSREVRKKTKGFSAETMELLTNHHWPGNIRELKNLVERAVLVSEESEEIKPKDLSMAGKDYFAAGGKDRRRSNDGDLISLDTLNLEVIEKEAILRALELRNWVQKDAAQLLGISPRALNYKINYHNITHPTWKKNT